MSPDVDFNLTHEEFESFEKILGDRGIRVYPKARETVEDLEKGGISHVRLSGILVFENSEFVYHIYKYPKRCNFTVDAFTHKRTTGEALVAEIKRAFPQPESSFFSQSATQRNVDQSNIKGRIGCMAVLLFIGAILFFAAVGIRSFFWK